MPLRIFFKETFKSSEETSFPVMPSMLPREGGSAILLEDGTLANQEFTPAASSRARSFATSKDPGLVRALTGDTHVTSGIVVDIEDTWPIL